MDIEISFSSTEKDYVTQQIQAGRAGSEGEVLRDALQLMMQREVDAHRKYEAWRERVRREIDEAYAESLTDEGVDGPTVLEDLRIQIESCRSQP